MENKRELVSLSPISRTEAKTYIKDCGICKEMFESKKPLYLLIIKWNDYSFESHIYTLEELNKYLRKLIK